MSRVAHRKSPVGGKPNGRQNTNAGGRSYGEQDETLHEIRAQVIAEIRRRKKSTRLSWPKIVQALRGNSAYAARMRGKTDATWIRYAKSGFSG